MGLRAGHVSISVWSDIASQDFRCDCTKDWVLSDVDPREGLDPTHLPTATWNGFAHAQVASCRYTETSSHSGTPGHWSSRHAPNDAETARCSCVARDRPSWDARIDTWNAKDAWGSGQIGPTGKVWLWGCGEPAWLEDGKKACKVYQFCGDWAYNLWENYNLWEKQPHRPVELKKLAACERVPIWKSWEVVASGISLYVLLSKTSLQIAQLFLLQSKACISMGTSSRCFAVGKASSYHPLAVCVLQRQRKH